MSIILPEIEIIDRSSHSVLYLEHGWPSSLCRWHSHAEYELHLIVATQGKAFVGDYIGEFSAGDLFLTGPNLPHNWVTDEVSDGDVALRDMLIQFDQTSLDFLTHAFPEFAEFKAMLTLAQSGIQFVGFDARVARSFLEAIRDSHGSKRVLIFLQFMDQINQHPHKKDLSALRLTHPQGNSKQARIGEVVDFIVNNYAENLSVERAASLAGMTPATFTRNFQNATGNRFVEFINRVRISQACSKLYATEEPVSSICYDVGFQNLANFNRHFMKIKSMTPSQYRMIARRELVYTPGHHQ